MGVYSRPFNKALGPKISFSGINILRVEDCAPFTFLRSWVLVISYLYSKFCIFNRPILEEYVYQVEGGIHLL